MNVKRGDIFYITKFGQQVGCEQHSGRPGIVVSCDENNEYATTVEIVYTTTRHKPELPTHVSILSTPMESTALCEQITTISTERISNFIGHCNEEEMANIDRAIMASLGLSDTFSNIKEYDFDCAAADEPEDNPDEALLPENAAKSEELVAVRTERDTYRLLYGSLINTLLRGRKPIEEWY